MGRKRRVPENAQRVEIHLAPADTVALKLMEALRQHRGEGRDSPSEIVSDAIWRFLQEVEHIPREEIEKRFPKKLEDAKKSNLARFPNNKKSSETSEE